MPESTPPKKKKAKHNLNAAQAADYLRQLADQLESGQISLIDEEMSLEGEVKVKESFKAKSGKSALKVQLKLSLPHLASGEAAEAPLTVSAPETSQAPSPKEPAEAEPTPAEPKQDEPPREEEDYSLREPISSYKKLKKRMSKDMRLIGKLLAAGILPSLELAQAFRADCRQMTSFPGKGDPLYDKFNQTAQALLGGVQNADLDAAAQAHDGLKQMKKDCHKEFK